MLNPKRNNYSDEFVFAINDELDNFHQAIGRIRELHKPIAEDYQSCIECSWDYPCSTIKALDGEQ